MIGINNILRRSYSTTTSTAAAAVKQQFSFIGLNQHVTFNAPVLKSNGTVLVSHQVEEKPFVPVGIQKKPLKHTFTEAQIGEMQQLRNDGQSQKKVAEKFETTPYIVGRLTKVSPEIRQRLIDNHQIRAPKVADSEETKKMRVDLWTAKNQQREYDMKVIKAAKSYEEIKYFRRAKHEIAYMANEETYDAMVSGQELLKPTLELDEDDLEQRKLKEEKKKEKKKSTARRRSYITDKEKARVNKQKKAKAQILSMMDD
ncbi:hypothetical protein PPL_05111 [Heterostelium album PN500]|uniref:Uncharacterized protein n=1 Tax=Heterostelium pallidum (strain ATCC 26659 / Pp 5 / PN500) TaxID=670386 RepID=D3B9G7_HETP5|nr:hypothetical protein PPL_05111 [Heterostelium album PN500]EFA81879.1 hypothetical protein PPL_05111 [Heterostelium album PN500]|eukprot:XP_020433996.1 hypothetical protein PPL_05111 [Heterostelium album PN500]